jgi:hypothetical protein
MFGRKLQHPSQTTLRDLIAKVEGYQSDDLDSVINADIDLAFFGETKRHCSECGSTGLYFPSYVLNNIDNAVSFAGKVGWSLRVVEVGKGTARAVLSNGSGYESEGVGKTVATAILSAVFWGQLKSCS